MGKSVLLLTVVVLLTACNSRRPALTSYQILYSRLGPMARMAQEADTAFVVTEVEWQPRPLPTSVRLVEARRIARIVGLNWPDPRLREVAVVFARPHRFGPIITRGHEDTLRLRLPMPEE